MNRRILLLASALLLTACTVSGPSPGGQSASSAGNLKTLQTGHFSVRYPSDWTVKSNVTMPEAGYEMLGTRLTYPAEKDHTTLLEAAMHLSFGSGCPSLDGIEITVAPDTVTIGGRQWTHYVRDGAAAGNRYQGDTYVYRETGSCYLISTLEHSCNIGPDCGEGHTTAFDKAANDAQFNQILSTFAFRQ